MRFVREGRGASFRRRARSRRARLGPALRVPPCVAIHNEAHGNANNRILICFFRHLLVNNKANETNRSSTTTHLFRSVVFFLCVAQVEGMFTVDIDASSFFLFSSKRSDRPQHCEAPSHLPATTTPTCRQADTLSHSGIERLSQSKRLRFRARVKKTARKKGRPPSRHSLQFFLRCGFLERFSFVFVGFLHGGSQWTKVQLPRRGAFQLFHSPLKTPKHDKTHTKRERRGEQMNDSTKRTHNKKKETKKKKKNNQNHSPTHMRGDHGECNPCVLLLASSTQSPYPRRNISGDKNRTHQEGITPKTEQAKMSSEEFSKERQQKTVVT